MRFSPLLVGWALSILCLCLPTTCVHGTIRHEARNASTSKRAEHDEHEDLVLAGWGNRQRWEQRQRRDFMPTSFDSIDVRLLKNMPNSKEVRKWRRDERTHNPVAHTSRSTTRRTTDPNSHPSMCTNPTTIMLVSE